jgi:hypothetical protein
MSPWLVSAGWTKKAGVPVDDMVAAILRATWPLLPMPVTITRPSAADISFNRLIETVVQEARQLQQRLALGLQYAAAGFDGFGGCSLIAGGFGQFGDFHDGTRWLVAAWKQHVQKPVYHACCSAKYLSNLCCYVNSLK